MWIIPDPFPELSSSEVHLWRVELGQNSENLQFFENILSRSEYERAIGLISKDRYQKFVFSRGLLKILLGKYLGIAPEDLIFKYTINGKPYIDGIHFNISHSKDLAVFAIAKDIAIGIDLEFMRPMRNLTKICHRYFSDQEYLQFCLTPENQRLAFFYNIWVNKEAYIKLIGGRLFDTLNKLKNENKEIEKMKNELIIRPLHIDESYAAALAMCSIKDIDVKYFAYQLS